MDDQAHDFYQITRQIATQLGETQPTPLSQIRRILHSIGPERAQAFVTQALAVEANGGMLLPDGSRKRTRGGIFFRLVRDQVSAAERQTIWPYPSERRRTQRPPDRPAPPPAAARTPPPAPLQGEQLEAAIDTASSHPGKATTVKVTVIGRPGEIVERQGVIILAMQSTAAPSLPKGLPAPPAQPTNYLIFVSKKQWQKVADALADAEDKLIIEGYPVRHPRFAGITVYATQVTTKLLQAAKRQQQAPAQ